MAVQAQRSAAHSLTGERQQHHRGLGGRQRVGCTRCHTQPGPRAQIELLGIDGEAKTSGQDLNDGGSSHLVLGELFAGVEGERGDVQPVAAVNHLGDDCAGLNGHFACRIGDQGVGHDVIMLQATDATRIRCSATLRTGVHGPHHGHVRAIVNGHRRDDASNFSDPRRHGYSAAAEDCDEEVGLVRQRAQIPRSEAQLHGQARRMRVCEEFVELVPTPGTEAGDDSAAFTKMGA
jgi:hypothetical protein